MIKFNESKKQKEEVYEVDPIWHMAWSNGGITFCLLMVFAFFFETGIPPMWVWMMVLFCSIPVGLFTNTSQFVSIIVAMNCECGDPEDDVVEIDTPRNTMASMSPVPRSVRRVAPSNVVTARKVDLFDALGDIIERDGCDLPSILIRARDLRRSNSPFHPTRSMFNQMNYVKTADYQDFIKIMDECGMTVNSGRGGSRGFTDEFFDYAISQCVARGW